jgi:hypothetical protein
LSSREQPSHLHFRRRRCSRPTDEAGPCGGGRSPPPSPAPAAQAPARRRERGTPKGQGGRGGRRPRCGRGRWAATGGLACARRCACTPRPMPAGGLKPSSAGQGRLQGRQSHAGGGAKARLTPWAPLPRGPGEPLPAGGAGRRPPRHRRVATTVAGVRPRVGRAQRLREGLQPAEPGQEPHPPGRSGRAAHAAATRRTGPPAAATSSGP